MRHRGAFTLVEVLLVVALLGFVALMLVNSASDLFRAKEIRADDVFWQGVTAARQVALESNRTILLRYDDEKHLLYWETEAETEPVAAQSLAFPGKRLEFLPATQQGMVLLGGQLTETDAIKLIRFYPDGACDAFRAQVTDKEGRRSLLSIDPWTCAPMLVSPPK